MRISDWSSDVCSSDLYDGVQMRGLPSGFTQVLINGRRAPGGEADGAFFVDRLPAEPVERIEIVRAPRADQPSEGVAGTLNAATQESVRDRKSVAEGHSVSVSVELGARRTQKKTRNDSR